MKILFVATRKNSRREDRELYEMEFMNEVLGFKRSLLDLGLKTVAAATPEDVEVEIVDEYLDPIPYDTDADLIALSAKTSCVPHAYEVAKEFRRHGKKVVLGGIHASLRPEEALEYVDHVVMGEAEKTWPKFVEEFREGRAPAITRSQGYPDMDQVPIPAWDKLDNGAFLFHQLQVTRGCPFTCRFCSVPDISGSTFRCKPIDKVIEEIRALPKSGGILGPIRDRIKALYIVDDNFISRRNYTKDLLRALEPLHKSGELREWSAETTLNVAYDEELLDLFPKAGCSTLILGLESVSEETLVSMNKKINFCLKFQDGIQRIHDRGMGVVGNFIVGFDTDQISVFKNTLDFINESLILYPFFSILTPMPGTKLHEDYKRDSRLDHFDWARYDTRHVVFEPKQMTRDQLMDGYIWLYEEAYRSEKALERLKKFWTKHGRRRSTKLENAFVRYRVRKVASKASSEFREFVEKGFDCLRSCDGNADVGQLLYYFDSAQFCDYLEHFKSASYEANVEIFKGERVLSSEAVTERMQWQREQAKWKSPPAASLSSNSSI